MIVYAMHDAAHWRLSPTLLAKSYGPRMELASIYLDVIRRASSAR